MNIISVIYNNVVVCVCVSLVTYDHAVARLKNRQSSKPSQQLLSSVLTRCCLLACLKEFNQLNVWCVLRFEVVGGEVEVEFDVEVEVEVNVEVEVSDAWVLSVFDACHERASF